MEGRQAEKRHSALKQPLNLKLVAHDWNEMMPLQCGDRNAQSGQAVDVLTACLLQEIILILREDADKKTG